MNDKLQTIMVQPPIVPEPFRLKKLMQSLAALDAIICPEWEYRYYSFDCRWQEGETMGSRRNGSGDELFVLFNESGAIINGFDHERWNDRIRPEDAYRDVPSCFARATVEPAFSPELVTFCWWRLNGTAEWVRVSVHPLSAENDGTDHMLSELDGDPEAYLSFARGYFEVEPDSALIAAIHAHTAMTSELARSINPAIDYAALLADLREIGYPIKAE